jgi:uncharacterized membrane protein YhaH (DUF805 family)
VVKEARKVGSEAGGRPEADQPTTSPGSAGRNRWWGDPGTVSVTALCVVGAVFAVHTAASVAEERGQPAYAMPAAVEAVAAACAALTVIGAVLALRWHEAGRAWFTTLTTLLFLWGYLALFSIGLLLIVAAVICLVMRIRLAEHRPSAAQRWRLGAGLMLSLGLAPLSALAINSPVVACMSDGVSMGTPVWMILGAAGESSLSGSAGGGASGSATSEEHSWGTVTVGGITYTYSCTGSHLTQFIAR